ncbi:hypothetical protein M5689_016365 [Euphorbia peplus]|nr:hypothetical protein M5689_016365 [Euphorbia peplus]
MTRFPPEKPQSDLMKQSSSSIMNDLDNQMEVASILLQLPHLIASRNRHLPLSWPAWGAKRKRSAEETPFLRRVKFSSPQSSNQEISAPVVPILEPEKQKPDAVKVEAAAATSPATPLLFSPSESDEKQQPKRLKRKLSVKKRKEELLQMEKECSIANEQVRKEMEQYRHQLNRLQSENLSLLARKQELSGGKTKTNRDDDGGAPVEESGNNNNNNDNNKKERMLPDLNVSFPVWMELYQPLDEQNKSYSKAMAAEARQRRMRICRDKNFGAAAITKLRISRK